MVSKKELVHMDVYNDQGVKTMEAVGTYSYDDLYTDVARVLTKGRIPVIRRAMPEEVDAEDDDLEELGDEEFAPGTGSDIYVHWSYNGVEFEAEGPAEYVLRASREMAAVLEVMAK